MSSVSVSHHVLPFRTNLIIFGTLVGLTLLTAVLDYVDLGPFNLIVALLIAGAKAVLVVLYFMHLRFSGRLTWAFVGMGLMFLAILIGMTFDDVFTRQWIRQPGGWTPLSR